MQISKIILGSSSPYRKQLLENTGLKFSAIPPDIDEKLVTHPLPPVLAYLRAEAKAKSLSQRFPGSLIIGADQVCDIGGTSQDKCHSLEDASRVLSQLSGKTHHLHNGLVLCLFDRTTGVTFTKDLTSMVTLTMNDLTDTEIADYLSLGEWQGSVGSYKFEGRGRYLFNEIVGDETAVIGLPVFTLLTFFRIMGINILSNAQGPWQINLDLFEKI